MPPVSFLHHMVLLSGRAVEHGRSFDLEEGIHERVCKDILSEPSVEGLQGCIHISTRRTV